MTDAIYNTATGEIVKRVTGSTAQVAKQAQGGEAVYANCPRTATHIIGGFPETRQAAVESVLCEIRMDRNIRLTACDWTQVPDAPVDKAAWAAYRQQLRDFPASCDPYNPAWPIPPA